MKRTTYLMLAAFVIGLGLVAAFVGILLSNPMGEYEPYQNHLLGGTETGVKLSGSFSTVVFNEGLCEYEYRIKNFKGLTVERSAKVTEPVIRMGADWKEVIRREVEDDTLRLTLDVRDLCESLIGKPGVMRFVTFESSESWPLTLVIPEGMKIDEIVCDQRSLMLENFDEGKLTVDVRNRLVVSGSTIGELLCGRADMDELKVSESTINYVKVASNDDCLKVNCCNGTGLIEAMEVKGYHRHGKDDSAGIDLTKANVKTLRWSPADSTATLNLTVSHPMELKEM